MVDLEEFCDDELMRPAALQDIEIPTLLSEHHEALTTVLLWDVKMLRFYPPEQRYSLG